MKCRIFIELLFLATTEDVLMATYLNFDTFISVGASSSTSYSGAVTINEMSYIHWVAFSDNYGRCFDGYLFVILYCVFNLNYVK